MKDNVGSMALYNSELIVEADIDNLYIGKEKVYEVIRVIDGVPLFLEDHYERMIKSFEALGVYPEIKLQQVKEYIEAVLKANNLKNCNVKLTSSMNKESLNILIYISSSYYPSSKEVAEGVKTSLANIERDKPNVKLINISYKEKVAKIMEDTKVFEVLLENEKGQVTEGSRSNLFFVKGKDVLTAPADQVLLGITRKYIIDICKKLNLNLIEAPIPIKMLDEMDGLFISGTSIKVQPVSHIDRKMYSSSSNTTIENIRLEFDKLIEGYIKKRK